MNETQPLPTDAELAAFTASAEWAAYETPMLVDFARAVLAKWGTPAPVGVEPAAETLADEALIRQLVEALEPFAYEKPAREAIAAGRARLEGKP